MSKAGSFLGLSILALSGSGCALERGTGFATLDAATLKVSLEPGAARDLGNGRLLTQQGYEVRVDQARVRVDAVQVQQVTGTDSEATFDPSHPPAGYSLCHSGHCHRDDGALIDYESIEVELAGGVEAFSPIVTLGFDEPLSLLNSQPTTADSYDPSRELDRSNPRRVLVSLAHFELEGTVTAGDLSDDELPLSIDLTLGIQLDVTLADLRIERGGPEHIELHSVVMADGTLFDDIDFAAIAEDGRVQLTDSESVAARALVAALAASETHATVD